MIASMTGGQMADLGLMFIKGESHPEKKVAPQRWHLIWNVSQIDTSIEMLINRSFDKALISPAIGIGHRDSGIQRVGDSIEMLKEQVVVNASRVTRVAGICQSQLTLRGQLTLCVPCVPPVLWSNFVVKSWGGRGPSHVVLLGCF